MEMDQKPKYESQSCEKGADTQQKSSQWVMINLGFARYFNRFNICLTSEKKFVFFSVLAELNFDRIVR